jgi:hypothetical protein
MKNETKTRLKILNPVIMKKNSTVFETLNKSKKQNYQSLSISEMMMIRGGDHDVPDVPNKIK